MPTASARWCGASCAAPTPASTRRNSPSIAASCTPCCWTRCASGSAPRMRSGCRLVRSPSDDGDVNALFRTARRRDRFTADGDVLVGADGIHSTLRAAFYPDEGAPVWNGTMLWRGAADWPGSVDGRTMVIAGGMAAKFVFYPIHFDPRAGPAADQLGGDGPHRRRPRRRRRAARTGTAPATGTRSSPSCATASGWISSIRWR